MLPTTFYRNFETSVEVKARCLKDEGCWRFFSRRFLDFVGITKRQHTPKIAAQKKDGTITGVP